MKKLLVLLFSLLISFHSYGEWLKADKSSNANFYIDFDTLKVVDSSLYVWQLTDSFKPTEDGYLSRKILVQGDCQLMRIKMLSIISFTGNMGEGIPSSYQNNNSEWQYIPPESVMYEMLDLNCFMAEALEMSPEDFELRVEQYREFLLD